jgi:hypothetical protein
VVPAYPLQHLQDLSHPDETGGGREPDNNCRETSESEKPRQFGVRCQMKIPLLKYRSEAFTT